MKRFPEKFDKTEGAILVALYEAPNDAYSSYTLAQALNPSVRVSTPAALASFVDTRAGTERLMVRGLVRAGQRDSGADGVYFNKLRLTPKGEKAAIQHRETLEKTKAALSEAQKHAQSVIDEMKKHD